ncbi:MAG TPA: phosphonate ABC transporter, permease protein PhnE [Plantibacter sp.]|uniref:phosphonate ABC transporter, permease protein PhnE n=1 Tax=unclassified Plantibacter TaxID=2624265 RepID=UPI002BC048B3|nr:phosphonate ABC transporter, permease protein PhnE [Plantibacter sp.]
MAVASSGTTQTTGGRARVLSGPVPVRRPRPQMVAAILTLVALLGFSVYSLVEVDISLPRMIASWGNAVNFFGRVGTITFPPMDELLSLTALTLGIVITGTVLAAVISIPVAYLAAANTTPGPAWRALGRFIGVLSRAVPDVVIAMILVLMFSLGSLPGIIAIGLHSIGMISKLFADAIEQIDEGPRLAIRAAGGSKLQQFVSGVLPQVMPSWVATVLHRGDINLRGSVLLGYVGVLGLGRELSLAFKSLDYSLGIGLAIVIFALCVVMEIVSSAVRTGMLGVQPTGRGLGDRVVRRVRAARYGRRPTTARTMPTSVASPDERIAAAARRPWTPARLRDTAGAWTAAAVVVWAIVVSDIQWGDLVTFWAKAPAVLARLWPPSFGMRTMEQMLGAMFETIAIAFAATFIALVCSIVVGSFAARNVAPNQAVRTGARFALVGIRGIPELILAILLIVVTGLGAQAGTLALGICGIGLLGKLIADSLEEVSSGPERALTAVGATRSQVYASATLPQGARALVGHTFYTLDTNIRAATMLGIVGGGGIGYYLIQADQGGNYDQVTAIVLMILAVVLIVEGIAMWMRKVFG